MLSVADTEFLARLVERARLLRAELNEAQDDRDNAVRIALEDGVPVAELVGVTGLTRARIYQIRG